MRRSFLFALLSFTVFVQGAQADSLGQTKNLRLEYTASALGLPLVKLYFDMVTQDGAYRVNINTRTTGLGRIKQFTYEAAAAGRISAGTVRPQVYAQYESSVKKGTTSSRGLEIAYDTSQRPTTTYDPVPKFRIGEEVSPVDGAGSYDPASFLAAISRFVMANQNCSLKGLMYDGRSMLEIRIKDQGSARATSKAYTGPGRRCQVSPVPVQGKATRDSERKYYEGFDAWIAQPVEGGPMVPIRMRTAFFIIPTVLQLTGIEEI